MLKGKGLPNVNAPNHPSAIRINRGFVISGAGPWKRSRGTDSGRALGRTATHARANDNPVGPGGKIETNIPHGIAVDDLHNAPPVRQHLLKFPVWAQLHVGNIARGYFFR